MLQRTPSRLERPATAAPATTSSGATTTALAARAIAKLTRRRSRLSTFLTPPPPLPLISLPPDDDWVEFVTPTLTGFGYTLPYMELMGEEFEDSSLSPSVANATPLNATSLDHERVKICRLLSEYMSQNEAVQTLRRGFGIDTRLVYKRCKDAAIIAASSSSSSAPATVNGNSSSSSSDDLSFDAFFESGNLDRAYRVHGRHYATHNELMSAATSSSTHASTQPPFPFFVSVDMEFDLYCDTDVNTHGHIQWYFFRATLSMAATATWRQQQQQSNNNSNSNNATKRLHVRFNIRNMLKKASLYNDGMLPAVYVDAPSTSRRSWHHAGTNVCYFKNADTYRSRKTGAVQHYYTLSFVYAFDVSTAADAIRSSSASASSPLVVYFAHCYPYPYTRLQRYLLSLQKDADRSRFVKRRVLCKTIAGNNCDVLTITDFSRDEDTSDARKRTGVVLTARVHPGESNSSFVMHGILDLLTGASLEARFLRHHFVFKIVPMLNPDGVIHGNYRCSLAGTDLNRRWTQPSVDFHPTIYATKAAILSMTATRHVSLYVDIHGHSRKKNIFLYGCKPFGTSRAEAARLRIFPHLLDKTSSAQQRKSGAGSGFYSFPDGTFSVSAAKQGTGRVVVWREAEVLHSFTLETSFFGVGTNRSHSCTTAGNGSRAVVPVSKHFTPFDLRMAGTHFGHALVPFAQVLHLDCAAAASMRTETASLATTPAPVIATAQSSTLRDSESSPAAPLNVRTTSPSSLQACGSKLRLAPLLEPAASASATASQAVGSTPSSASAEFDALFHDDSMAALLALADPDDMLQEIEATLPDVLADNYNDDDDASIGSESDPSGDNMDDDERRQRNGAHAWQATDPRTAGVKEATLLQPSARPQRFLRQLSEPRLLEQPVHLQQALAASAAPIRAVSRNEARTASSSSLHPRLRASTPAATTPPSTTLAPVRKPSRALLQCVASLQSAPNDRNRDIAVLHLRAVQRRSRTRRKLQHPIHEVLEH